jgi:hypothetical protein
MKAVLEFNLPEERDEFELAQRGGAMSAFIEDLDNELRRITKYDASIISEGEAPSDEEKALAEYVRGLISDFRALE